jgi:hypothetical protein
MRLLSPLQPVAEVQFRVEQLINGYKKKYENRYPKDNVLALLERVFESWIGHSSPLRKNL